jgi:uncharacterized MAPEG superfamily protein
MTQELWIAVYAAVLGIVMVLLPPVFAYSRKGYAQWNAGPRDTPFDMGPHADRLRRAFANFMETYAFFAFFVIALTFSHKSSSVSVYGAWIYLGARIVYIPLYVFGVAGIRSLVWAISLGGIVAIAVSLFV